MIKKYLYLSLATFVALMNMISLKLIISSRLVIDFKLVTTLVYMENNSRENAERRTEGGGRKTRVKSQKLQEK